MESEGISLRQALLGDAQYGKEFMPLVETTRTVGRKYRGFPGMSLAILPIEGAAAGGPSAPDSADDSGASELANHTGAAGSANLDDERRAAIHRGAARERAVADPADI